MHFLLPADPFDRASPDEAYAEEHVALQEAGLPVSLFSFEDFESGTFKVRPAIPDGAQVIYRGWMLTLADYKRLAAALEQRGARLITSPEQYRLCHHLPGWYSVCSDLTPRTVFFEEGADPSLCLTALGSAPYFVKDYVKSLTTERGSVARSIEEVTEIVRLLKQFRGHVEGGVCVREFIELKPETEDRFFVVNGQPMGKSDEVPAIVAQVAARVASPFFSVDVASRMDGNLIVIELGDGQVSDKKSWPAGRFVEALLSAAY